MFLSLFLVQHHLSLYKQENVQYYRDSRLPTFSENFSLLHFNRDVVHVESYFAEVDIGGKIGKLGCCLMMEHWFKEAIKLADKIPQMPDVTAPPYVQFL